MLIACFDLETSNLSADYGIVLCGVIKPIFSDQLTILRWDEQVTFRQRPWEDRQLVVALRDTLETYDIIVSYNGKLFDVPFLNARLLYYNERTLKLMKHIDLYQIARWKFKLSRNSLENFAEFLKVEHRKTKIDGNLWVKALVGASAHGKQSAGREAMDDIVDHCVKDVLVLEECYMRIKDVITYIKAS